MSLFTSGSDHFYGQRRTEICLAYMPPADVAKTGRIPLPSNQLCYVDDVQGQGMLYLNEVSMLFAPRGLVKEHRRRTCGSD